MAERLTDSNNCLEIIRPFVNKIGDMPDVQIMGGLGTAALELSDTRMSFEAKEIIAPKGFSLPAYRKDSTKRDVDVLVLSSDPARIADVEDALEESIGTQLERSVFGIRPHEVLQMQMANPLGFRAFRTFVSDRYESDDAVRGDYLKSLFPFAVPIDPESLETWTLVAGENEARIPIPHPGITIANYLNRSIDGLRPRDEEKIGQVAENVFWQAPQIKEWLKEGPGKSQLELATLIASLRHRGPQNISLVEGLQVRTLSRTELMYHPGFMMPDYPDAQKETVINRSAFKAKGLHFFSTNPAVVMLWRRIAERQAGAIVKNA